MKSLWLIACCAVFVFGGVTDKAYKEYKAKHYEKAFALYQKAYNQGDRKAIYNLATFYDKGIGTKKDRKRAIKLYQEFIDTASNKIYSGAICVDDLKKYYVIALKKLIEYQKDSHYKELLDILNQNCQRENDFIQKCPYAKVVAPGDRYNLTSIDCVLYKKYPKNLKKFFHYQRLLRSVKDSSSSQYNKYTKKIDFYIDPIIKYYLRKEIECIKKANLVGDIVKCEAAYLGKRDDILSESNIENFADSRELFSSEEEKEKRKRHERQKATEKEKQELIDRIKSCL